MSTSRFLLLCGALCLLSPVTAGAAEEKPITADIINAVQFDPAAAGAKPDERSPLALKLQVLLDGAEFSPGVIDGYFGDNVTKALAAYETAQGLTADGTLDSAVWEKLTAGDPAPAFTSYTITDEDLKGPFAAEIPSDYAEMAKLKNLPYTSAAEMLAERFHMDFKLLMALNPDAAWDKAGTAILVAATRERKIDGKAEKVVISRATSSLRALGADGKLLAFFPVTVGSDALPSPTGTHKVKVVVHNPDYSYRPDVNFKQGANTENMVIPPGPNGPVGTVWIGLDKPTYGIHGTAEPSPIGKHFSHGCARLTNWDAETLAKLVQPGVTVSFED